MTWQWVVALGIVVAGSAVIAWAEAWKSRWSDDDQETES